MGIIYRCDLYYYPIISASLRGTKQSSKPLFIARFVYARCVIARNEAIYYPTVIAKNKNVHFSM